jgi:cobalt-precorrin 5A hydrolase
MIVAGLGCRPSVEATAILDLLAECGEAITHLAAPAFRRQTAALQQAAARMGLPLLWVEDAALAAVQPLCPTRSEAAFLATGFHSVAEGCALAAAGRGAVLLRARMSGAGVTCAVAAGSVS